MKVVLDANVLLAAFAARGLCEAVYQVCLGKHEIALSEHILTEVRRGLAAKLKLGTAHVDQIMALIRENAQIVKPAKIPANACRDSDDLPVLGTLAAAQADCLVTGDHDLLTLKEFSGIPILSPRAFHDRLR